MVGNHVIGRDPLTGCSRVWPGTPESATKRSYSGINRGDVLLAATDVVFLCAVGAGLYVTCSKIVDGARKGKSPLNLFSGG